MAFRFFYRLLVGFGRSDRHAHHAAFVLHFHDTNALGVSGNLADLFGADTDNYAVVGDHHHVVGGIYKFEVYKFAGDFVELTRKRAFARARLNTVFVDIAALAVAVLRHGEHFLFAVLSDDRHIDHAFAAA